MNPQAYTFNSNATYPRGGKFKASLEELVKNRAGTSRLLLTRPRIQVRMASSEGEALDRSFEAVFPNVFEKYALPPVRSDKVINAWRAHPMQFWQNQLNFALWASTAGCGVSLQDHIFATDPLIASVYRFHVYFQTRRILAEMQAPLPQDRPWDPYNNPYDRQAYERIADEFGVPPETSWRVNLPNGGLGMMRQRAHGVGVGDDTLGTYSAPFNGFSWGHGVQVKIDHIGQEGIEGLWATFVLDRSFGFTQPGVERLNDSIRAYVWAILGAQGQTRSKILGTGTSFDAQKQFLANVEDAIASPVDLPSAIKRYQDALHFASSRVDFSFGIGLYMAPSDMLLRIGRIQGYNNEIVIATTDVTLGVNEDLNLTRETAPPPSHPGTSADFEGDLVRPQTEDDIKVDSPLADSTARASHVVVSKAHEDEKTALVVGGVAVGILTLWLLR